MSTTCTQGHTDGEGDLAVIIFCLKYFPIPNVQVLAP